jgi:hypothetical protein
MGKRSGSSALRKSAVSTNESNTSNTGSSFGGFGGIGSGVMGVVRCDVNDDSWYCTMSKYYSALMMVFGVLFLMYMIYRVYQYFSNIQTRAMTGGGCNTGRRRRG